MSTSVEGNFDTCREWRQPVRLKLKFMKLEEAPMGGYIEKVGLRVTRYLSRIDAQLLHA
jgi:hypothetical protein